MLNRSKSRILLIKIGMTASFNIQTFPPTSGTIPFVSSINELGKPKEKFVVAS